MTNAMGGRKKDAAVHPAFLQRQKINAPTTIQRTNQEENIVVQRNPEPIKLTFEQWAKQQPVATRICILILADNDTVYKHVTDGNMTIQSFIEWKKLARNMEKEYPKDMAAQIKSAKAMLL